MLLALTLSLPLAGPLPTQEADDRPHVVFLTGDEEYRSEESMPMLAALLEEHYGCRTTVLYALDEQGYIAPNHLTNIAGLEALEDADLMVMFTRFRALPDDQLQHILDYAASGRPMVGFRTATHPFLYPEGDARRKHNDGFAIEAAPLMGFFSAEVPRWMSWALGDLAVKLLVSLAMLAPYRILLSALRLHRPAAQDSGS